MVAAAVIAGLAVGIAFVMMFAVLSQYSFPYYEKTKQKPQVSIVKIVSALQTAPDSGFDPKVITVKIGVNSTVRWVNVDAIPHGIPTPNYETNDPDFAEAVKKAENSTETPGGLIQPNGTFEYTFTKPGRFDLHMAPHPYMQDTVIVLPAFP